MGEYRKKPVVIEAVQFTGSRESFEDLIHQQGGITGNWFYDGEKYKSFLIYTLEGPMTVSLNDWVIKGVKGEFYPCKPDIFEATYEPVRKEDA